MLAWIVFKQKRYIARRKKEPFKVNYDTAWVAKSWTQLSDSTTNIYIARVGHNLATKPPPPPLYL